MRRYCPLLAPITLMIACPQSALGQSAADAADPARDEDAVFVPPATETHPRSVWVAGVSGGAFDRDGGTTSPFGTASVTRYEGQSYMRLSFTAYRSTLEQTDAALPSTYYVGSVGVGGNWDGWVADGYVSLGLQDYGSIETDGGTRKSQAGDSSPYVAAGLRLGYMFEPAPRWYVTPLVGAQYTKAKSLRFLSAQDGTFDFELRERSFTGNAGLRIDRALGKERQHDIGLSFTHFESDNGLTSWRLPPPGPGFRPVPVETPDGWQELGLSATVRLSPRLWLGTEAQRTFGTVGGDGTTVSAGLRLRM